MRLFGMSGVHVPHRKNTAGCAPTRMPPPASVSIPLSMGIGAPSVLTVQPGDKVLVGQKIAEAGGFVGAPIYASVSGTFKKTETYRDVFGRTVTALLIEFRISGFGREGDAVPAAACGCLAGCALFLILLGLTGCRQAGWSGFRILAYSRLAACSGFRILAGSSSAAALS